MSSRIPLLCPWDDDEILPCILQSSNPIKRLILLNAAVVPAKNIILFSMPITSEEAKVIASKASEIISYIGHEATAKLLSQYFGVNIPTNRGEYEPQDGDLALVARLTRRLPAPGGDVKELSISDLTFLIIRYMIPQKYLYLNTGEMYMSSASSS